MKISKEMKIGVFVTAVLVVSFCMINYLRGKDLFNKEIEISARYSNVEGLLPSAPVYIKGYKAGKVIAVDYIPESDDFAVTCSVMREFRIPSDSRMVIYGVDIMGGKGIRIDLGSSSELAADGSVIASSSEPAFLDGLASVAAPLIEKVGNTLDTLNVAVTSVNRILAEGNISKTLLHMEMTMAEVRSIASNIDGKSEELNAFIDNLAQLSSKLVVLADNANDLMSDASSAVSQISIEELNRTVGSFRELLEKVNDPDGSIGKLLTDDSVYDSIDSLLYDVDSLVRKIQENPKKYIKISIF